MLQFLSQLVQLITLYIGDKHEEDQYEIFRGLMWQFRNTEVDVEELRAHIDPTYWGKDEQDDDPGMIAMKTLVWTLI